MCGIAGVLAERGVLPTQIELERMISAVAHRGPDGYGFYLQNQIGLAHARLSIIDLEGGKQPIHNEDQTVWVVFNGEIFNYRELRESLSAQGHRFYTHSDTEVIVHLYEQYGDQFVQHLNGQFAIALWDSQRERLLLTRDRVGIRPLFYCRYQGRLRFASEIKSLLNDPDLPRRLDLDALADVFTYWAVSAPRSSFEHIQQLPPGHTLVIEKNGHDSLSQYWDWPFPEEDFAEISAEQAAHEVREQLIKAVRLQLRADVPVGAYLSGGLDSSILTTIIKNYTDTPLRTFSIAFDDDEFDESGFQQELVDYLGTHHSSFRCSRRDIADAFPRTVWFAETPILRTAPTPLMLLSEHVRAQGYKVVLTGEGADEVYGGYDLFKEAKIRRFWSRQPNSTWRPRLLEKLYPYLKHSPVAAAAFTQNFFAQGTLSPNDPAYAHQPRWTTTQRIWQFFNADAKAQLKQNHYEHFYASLPPSFSHWHPLNRDQYVEATTFMTSYLLSSQGDRVAMANSIEGRVPFLDHNVIEHACRLPPKLKIRGLTEKHILREAMRDVLPPSIYRRTKQPYRAPDCQSFFDNGIAQEYVAELFHSRVKDVGYFDAAAVAKLYDKCRLGRAIGFADNMAFVGILSTLLLQEMFVQPTSPTPWLRKSSLAKDTLSSVA